MKPAKETSEKEAVRTLEKAIKNVVKELETIILAEKICCTGRDTEDIELAIAAMGKLISVKPKYEIDSLQYYAPDNTIPYCPICHKVLLDEMNDDCFQYCPDCGQKIEWE